MSTERARAKLLAAWDPPSNAGEPVGLITSTFNFDAGFFEEELLGRFITMEGEPNDARAYLAERETRLGEVLATVLVDRRHVNRSNTLAWDLLPVPVPHGCCQHAKVTVLAWKQCIRLIVASANLTEAAYRRNLEVFASFDFVEGGEVPASLLRSMLDLHGRMVERVPGPADEGPRARAQRLLAEIRGQLDALSLPAEWPRGVIGAHPVVLEPGAGPGVLQQMDQHWGGGPRPDVITVCSPYWGDPDAEGRDPVTQALTDQLTPRGDRCLDIRVPGEPHSADEWVAFVPESILTTPTRAEVRVWPTPELQGDERRSLHAKLLRWARTGSPAPKRDLLLIGSTNATPPGLGLSDALRNIEANVCFVSDGDRATARWFEACFPETAPKPTTKLERREGADAEEGEGAPALPAFFSWASFKRDEATRTLEVHFADDEPDTWRLWVEHTGVSLGHALYRAKERPALWTFTLEPECPVPDVVDVEWSTKTGTCRSALAVNALDDGSRCDPAAWADLDLDALLAILGDGGPLFRRLMQIASRKNGDAGSGVVAAELDPHKRVDTRGFLMQRMRRISRALEGLSERLSKPIVSATQLSWRFEGPLAPHRIGERVASYSDDPVEVAFLLAELVLTVRRAARVVEVDGIPHENVDRNFRDAIERIVSQIPEVPSESRVAGYVERATKEARC